MSIHCKKINYNSEKSKYENTFSYTFYPTEYDGIFDLDKYIGHRCHKLYSEWFPKGNHQKYSKFKIITYDDNLINELKKYDELKKERIKEVSPNYLNQRFCSIVKKDQDKPYINLKINLQFNNGKITDLIHKKINIFKNNHKLENVSIYKLNDLIKDCKVKVYFRPSLYWCNHKYYGISLGLVSISINNSI